MQMAIATLVQSQLPTKVFEARCEGMPTNIQYTSLRLNRISIDCFLHYQFQRAGCDQYCSNRKVLCDERCKGLNIIYKQAATSRVSKGFFTNLRCQVVNNRPSNYGQTKRRKRQGVRLAEFWCNESCSSAEQVSWTLRSLTFIDV